MYFEHSEQDQQLTLQLIGRWDVDALAQLEPALLRLPVAGYQRLQIDAGKLEALDTAGAWLLAHFIEQAKALDIDVVLDALNAKQRSIFNIINEHKPKERPEVTPKASWVNLIERIGEGAVNFWDQCYLLIAFIGHMFISLKTLLLGRRRVRFTSMVRHIDEAGISAIPIIALIAFLTSVVLAYQGAMQLKQFGAEIFTIDLVAISILREMGVLLTAIMVAGRSGSAFAAEIGVMKVNEEVDAMRTIGLNPFDILVMPRVAALLIALPMLTFIADLAGLIGAALMSIYLLDISLTQFFVRAHEAIGFWTFAVGMIKAPFFAFIIAAVGCLKGLQVSGSAEKVGEKTTAAVVQAIFIVILADAIFSIIFSEMGI